MDKLGGPYVKSQNILHSLKLKKGVSQLVTKLIINNHILQWKISGKKLFFTQKTLKLMKKRIKMK